LRNPEAEAPAGALARGLEPGPRNGSILADALSSWVVAGLVIVSGLLFAPLIRKSAGDSGYGLWRTLYQIIGYYGVLEVGIRAAAVRFIAIAWSQEDRAAMRGILGACFAFAGVLFALVVPACIVFAGAIVPRLGADAALAADGVGALRIMALAFGVSAFSGILSFSIHGACKIHLANRVELVALSLRTGLGVLALVHFGTLTALACANLAGSLAALGGYLFLFRHLYTVRPSIAEAHRSRWLQRVLTFATKIYGVKIGDVLTNDVSVVVTASVLSLQLAGVLGYVLALVGFATIVVVNLCDAMYPRLSAIHAERPRLVAATLTNGGVVAMVAFAFLGGFIALGPDFIHTWIGPDVGRDAGVSLPAIVAVVGAGRLAALATLPMVYALRAVDRVEVYALFNFLEGVLGVGAMIALASGFGLLGLVTGSLLAALLFRLCILPLYAGRVLGVPSGRIFAALVLRPALTLVGLLPVVVLLRATEPSGWMRIAAMMVATGVLLFGSGFFLGITPEARALLVERALGIVGRTRSDP
jgi:O-antigen/teichoic acid export membrane protein